MHYLCILNFGGWGSVISLLESRINKGFMFLINKMYPQMYPQFYLLIIHQSFLNLLHLNNSVIRKPPMAEWPIAHLLSSWCLHSAHERLSSCSRSLVIKRWAIPCAVSGLTPLLIKYLTRSLDLAASISVQPLPCMVVASGGFSPIGGEWGSGSCLSSNSMNLNLGFIPPPL